MFKDDEIEQDFIQDVNRPLLTKRWRSTTKTNNSLLPWCLNEDPNSPEDDIEEALRR